MIVNITKDGLHIIYHAAHGLLAGKIANSILEKYRPLPWFETLVAVTEHDDRQLDFSEKKYLSDIGVPTDFTEEKQTIYQVLKRMRRVINHADTKSSWSRLLISYHLEFLYGQLRNKSKKIDSFFSNEKEQRAIILKAYNTLEEQANKDYQFLRFCDRLSLILCKDETPELGRIIEINTSIDNLEFVIKKSNDERLIIEPWIFKQKSFELNVEERFVRATQFKSSADFEKTLIETKPTLKTWQLTQSD